MLFLYLSSDSLPSPQPRSHWLWESRNFIPMLVFPNIWIHFEDFTAETHCTVIQKIQKQVSLVVSWHLCIKFYFLTRKLFLITFNNFYFKKKTSLGFLTLTSGNKSDLECWCDDSQYFNFCNMGNYHINFKLHISATAPSRIWYGRKTSHSGLPGASLQVKMNFN